MKRKELKSLTLQKKTISTFELNLSTGAGPSVNTINSSKIIACTIPIGVTANTCFCEPNDPNNTAA